MLNNQYALLGSWRWYDCDDDCGLTVCKCSQDGELEPVKNYFPRVAVGSPVLISKNKNLYFVDETKHTEDRRNEGGYAYAAKLKGTDIELINRIKTYTSNPCYCVLDKTEKYMIVVHHGSTRSIAIKLKKDKNGKVTNELTYDDAAVELIRINDDGSLGEIVDFDVHDPEIVGDKMSLLHQVLKLPCNENIFLVTDKGLDRYYTYRINYETEKLELIDNCKVTDYAHPKYVGFYPEEKIMYCVYEKSEFFAIVSYDENGKLKHIKDIPLQIKDHVICGTADFIVSPKRKKLYVGISGDDLQKRAKDKNKNLYHAKYVPSYLAVYDIEDYLNPVLTQCVPSNGSGVRQLHLSPDNSHLLVMNTDEGGIAKFVINEDESVTYKNSIDVVHPECLTYFKI